MYAEKAVAAGNDQDAKIFLMQKKALVEKQTALQQAYNVAADNSQKMRQMHDKLTQDIATLYARRDAVKAKVAVAKTQQKVNEIGASVTGANRDMSAFNRMEERANKMLDEANAMAELNAASQSASVEDLKLKYDVSSMSDVDDELAALKASMGMATQGE